MVDPQVVARRRARILADSRALRAASIQTREESHTLIEATKALVAQIKMSLVRLRDAPGIVMLTSTPSPAASKAAARVAKGQNHVRVKA